MPYYGVVEGGAAVSGRSSRPYNATEPIADIAQLMRMMAMSRPGFDAETRLAFLSISDPKNAGYY